MSIWLLLDPGVCHINEYRYPRWLPVSTPITGIHAVYRYPRRLPVSTPITGIHADYRYPRRFGSEKPITGSGKRFLELPLFLRCPPSRNLSCWDQDPLMLFSACCTRLLHFPSFLTLQLLRHKKTIVTLFYRRNETYKKSKPDILLRLLLSKYTVFNSMTEKNANGWHTPRIEKIGNVQKYIVSNSQNKTDIRKVVTMDTWKYKEL